MDLFAFVMSSYHIFELSLRTVTFLAPVPWSSGCGRSLALPNLMNKCLSDFAYLWLISHHVQTISFGFWIDVHVRTYQTDKLYQIDLRCA